MAEGDFPYACSVAAERRAAAIGWLRRNVHPAGWSMPESEPFDGRLCFRLREHADRAALHAAIGRLADDEPGRAVPAPEAKRPDAKPPGKVDPPPDFRLHIGGIEARAGWHILNIQPGPNVDFVGDCTDLGRFPDQCCREIYASHVLEHLPYRTALPAALGGFRRILRPGGILRIGVPDLAVLCRLFVRPGLAPEGRFHLMRMMFGGQIDAHDFHTVGLDFDLLSRYLRRADFTTITRVETFGLFDDASAIRFDGELISLNIEAT